MKKSRLLFLLILPLVFVAFPLFRLLAPGDDRVERVPGTAVRLGSPRIGPAEEVLRYPGNLRPESTTAVVPRIAGEVLRIHVGAGDAVSAGQLLVSIDDEVVRLQMRQAQAAADAAEAQLAKARAGAPEEEVDNARALVAQAEEDLEVARSSMERTRRLFEAGTIARAQFEDAENQFRSAETQVQNARRSLSLLEQGARDEDLTMAQANADAAARQLELAELQLDYAQIRAPISGTVASVLVEEGNMVDTRTPVVALVNDNLITIRLAVPEEHYGRVRTRGTEIPARVHPVAYPDRDPFPGTVSAVSPVIDAASRTFEVEVVVNNSAGLLRPGMYANVELVLSRQEQAILVPTRAVLFRDGAQVVFVAEEGNSLHAAMREVDVGVEQDGFFEIRGGLAPDDRLIVEGNAFLEDGALLRVLDIRDPQDAQEP